MAHRRFLIVLAACFMFTLPAFGDVTVIDFAHTGPGGTITVNAGNAIGVNIPISSLVLIVNQVQVGAKYAVTGSCAGGTGCLAFDTNLGNISLTGAIAALNVALQPLLTGTITTKTLIQDGSGLLLAMGGQDTKAPDLLNALSIPSTTHFAHLSSVIGATAEGGGYTANSIDVQNIAVPESGSTGFLLALLLGCAVPLSRLKSPA